MPRRSATLRQIRKWLGLTQEDMANRMYMSRSRISYLETHAPRDQMVRTLDMYTAAFGGTIELWVRMEDGKYVQLQVDRPG